MARQIAAEFGVTRNAILGKVNRLGLSAARSVLSPEERHARKLERERECYRKRLEKRGVPVKKKRSIVLPFRPPPPQPSLEISFWDLNSKHCRFITDGEGLDARYCGHPIYSKSCCGYHYSISYEAPKVVLAEAA